MFHLFSFTSLAKWCLQSPGPNLRAHLQLFPKRSVLFQPPQVDDLAVHPLDVDKTHPASRQTPAISGACSPAALHAVPSAGPNPSICPAGTWQEATAASPSANQNQIRPTLSIYLFLFSSHLIPLPLQVAFFHSHLHSSGNYFGNGRGLATQ